MWADSAQDKCIMFSSKINQEIYLDIIQSRFNNIIGPLAKQCRDPHIHHH